MEFIIFCSFYIFFILWFVILFKKFRISLYTVVYFIYTFLIGIPFFIIFAEIENVYLISSILGRAIDAKVTLSLGNGYKPITYLLIFNFIYLFFGSIYSYEISVKTKYLKLNSSKKKKIFRFSKYLFIVSICYIAIRYVYYPDFPLFVVLKSGFSEAVFRDLAFFYGSNTNIPYVFLPSVNSQFYRILLPVSFFLILYYYENYNKTTQTKILLIFVLILVVILNFGTFKRTPILYLSIWFIVYKYMYSDDLKIFKKIFSNLLITVFSLIFITSLYSNTSFETVVLNLFSRLAIGEAIGEFIAIEHYGTTFEYLFFDIPTSYIKKVLGMNVITFSEQWKILSGGTRGYTSIGIIAELIISFGKLSILFFIFFTILILKLDLLFKKYKNTVYRPLIAGVITIMSFMMVKGFFAQLFTGGVLVLIIVMFRINFIIKGKYV